MINISTNIINTLLFPHSKLRIKNVTFVSHYAFKCTRQIEAKYYPLIKWERDTFNTALYLKSFNTRTVIKIREGNEDCSKYNSNHLAIT